MSDNTEALPPFDDPRVQVAYRVLCEDPVPPEEHHWEGYVARRIVAALATPPAAQAEPVAIPNECVATGRSCSFTWHGPNGERQCEPCGDTPAAQAGDAQTTCNCRWVGDKLVQQCTLHEAWRDAIHDWSQRAKTAEAALAARGQAGDERTQAVQDVLAERCRQIEAEGWTTEHDDEHGDGSMARAAACYALHAGGVPGEDRFPAGSTLFWPREWARSWWKPKDARHNLIRAGALILAEIERLDRAALRGQPEVQA
jgi:hypothetical protein